MSVPSLPLSSLRVPEGWARAAERGRLVLHASSWLTLPAGAWLVLIQDWNLMFAGILGVALMPLVLQIILLPGHLLARRHGRFYVLGAAILTAISLAAWTEAAAFPVLDREHLPLALRLLWGYCVAVLPLALMSTADEDSFIVFAGALQIQLGVLIIALAHAFDIAQPFRLAGLTGLAFIAAWAVFKAWCSAHPHTR